MPSAHEKLQQKENDRPSRYDSNCDFGDKIEFLRRAIDEYAAVEEQHAELDTAIRCNCKKEGDEFNLVNIHSDQADKNDYEGFHTFSTKACSGVI